MPGTRSQSASINDTVQAYSNTAVTLNQILFEYVAPAFFRFGGIKFFAVTAGVGAGSTVIDVQVNGTTVWATAANRPTLAAASTGEFNNTRVDPGSTGIRPGDRITVIVTAVPATTGHARVFGTVALETD